jgi:anaerobic selenocysteine-containing dehydrogenase
MTETARVADYVLPASSQFEKAEATFFATEFPDNAFHVRQPVFSPRPGTLPESEIHARLIEALGTLSKRDYVPLRAARRLGTAAYAATFFAMQALSKRRRRHLAVLLYRTLGDSLPEGMSNAAVVWGMSQLYVMGHRRAAANAGFRGPAPVAAQRLFDALLASPSGLVFAKSDTAASWKAVGHPGHRIALHIPELVPSLAELTSTSPSRDPEYPFLLAAGERRTDTANTAVRDPSWHRKGRYGTLRIHPRDAEALGCVDGERVLLTTRRGQAEVELEVTDTMRVGSLSLPNGQGLAYRDATGVERMRGVAVNELTDHVRRDPIAGTPWHKIVPAKLERLSENGARAAGAA